MAFSMATGEVLMTCGSTPGIEFIVMLLDRADDVGGLDEKFRRVQFQVFDGETLSNVATVTYDE